MTTTTVTVGDLYKLINILTPFTAADSYEIPSLAAIRIEAGPGRGGLVGVATDRYVIGHMRINATGDDLAPTLVPRRWAKVLRRALSDVPSNTLATLRQVPGLTRAEDRLEVATESLTISFRIETRAAFPDLSKTFESVTADGLAAPLGLNPALIARFDRAVTHLQWETPRWTFSGPQKPIRIELGTTFVGLVMPVRLREGDLSPVPVGLTPPAEPGPESTGKPAQNDAEKSRETASAAPRSSGIPAPAGH